ncbi:GGDEF domain-containing protein [Paenibacillus chitinolyticus]|uniref:GGDEF domain-containing protein n=1 Tax=Paenibacillus chitinolyticus TaxID=79263 RepID=UPI002DB57775|nr:GGDEF domain-containing protein [Paenibacillus chitinolyticus]MEC0248645.1 GGDEF domain-containing protein [Paenibacillus chitinolyticus]
MSEYLVALTIACTLVTLSYLALKIQRMHFFENYEKIASPVLTGLACILLMQQPLSLDTGAVDLRYLPVVMAGLRYGLGNALFSTLIPTLYCFLTAEDSMWVMQTLQSLIIPAVLSSGFHRSEFRTGSKPIPIRAGLKISVLLFLTQVVIYAAVHTGRHALSESYPLLFMSVVSAVSVCLLIGMSNDENAKWLTQRKLEMKASQDLLTGLPNLRSFFEIAGRTLGFREVSIFMIDIDNFKQYNDCWGHLHGDQLLRETGRLLKNVVAEHDYIARYGGEEFILMSTETDPVKLREYAEKIRLAVAAYPFEHAETTPVTVSIGISAAADAATDLQLLIDEADRALYISKNTGKNRITLCSESPEPALLEQQNAY